MWLEIIKEYVNFNFRMFYRRDIDPNVERCCPSQFIMSEVVPGAT